jgi:hypothetical protein
MLAVRTMEGAAIESKWGRRGAGSSGGTDEWDGKGAYRMVSPSVAIVTGTEKGKK